MSKKNQNPAAADMREHFEKGVGMGSADSAALSTRQYPTIEKFLETVPILRYDIEGYLTDTRGQLDWSADAIADFSSHLGLATTSVTSEAINVDENGEGGEWKIHAEVAFIDTGCTEISEITQPRQTTKTDFKTKEQHEEDDPFSLEKAVARAIRNAKKRAFPAKRLLQMLFDAREAKKGARSELQKQMGAYKEIDVSPRELIQHAEFTFGIEQDDWQAKQWNAFKDGITDGAKSKQGLFQTFFISPPDERMGLNSESVNAESVNAESVNAEPENTEPPNSEPSNSEPEDEQNDVLEQGEDDDEETNENSEIPEDYA